MISPIRLEKRGYLPTYLHILLPLLSVVFGLLFCAIILQLMGYNVWIIYGEMLKGSFGSKFGINDTILKSIPLMLSALGVSIAFKMLIWNIGAEGQFCMGAFAATGVALFWTWIPPGFVLPAMLLAGFVGGAIWAALAILPTAFFKVNETIVTLLMNYIAIHWLDYFIYGPWKDPNGFNFPITAMFPNHALLPYIPGTSIHIGLIIAFVAAIILYFIFDKTTWGYQIAVIGENRKAAAYGGLNIIKNIILVMVVSGGLVGIAGMVEVSGVAGRLQPGISGGYGYTAISIAYLSKFNPLAVIVVSFLFGGLLVGGFSLQAIGLPAQIVTMMQGAILFSVLGFELLTRYKIRRARKEVL